MNPGELRIPFNKLQLAWRAILFLVLACTFAVFTVDHGRRVDFIVVGPICFVLCAWMVFDYSARIFSWKPALLVTPEWIINRSYFGSVAIMWQDIAMLFRYGESKQQYIAIVPYDLREILARQTPWTRLQLSLIRRLRPMPIKIWVSVLPVTVDQLWNELREYAKLHVPHLAEDIFQEGESSRQAENESAPESSALETPAPADIHPESDEPIRGKKPRTITVTTAGKILPLAIPLIGIVTLVHAVIPAFEVAGYVITLAIACVLMVAMSIVNIESFDRPLWLSLVFGAGSLGFAVAHGWFEGVIVSFAAIATAFLITTTIIQFRLGRLLRHVYHEMEANLRDLQHRRGY